MADIAITLKLTASEFQTLRTELVTAVDQLREQQRVIKDKGPEGRSLADRDKARELMGREAQIAMILEKLG